MAIARKGLWLSASTYLVLLLGLVHVYILSRSLGPAGVGQMTLFRQTFLLFVQLASLGLPYAMIQRIRSQQVDPGVAVYSVLYTSGILSLLTGTVAITVLWTDSGRFFGEVDALILLAAAIWIPSVMLRAVLYDYQIAKLNVRAMIMQEAFPPAVLAIWYIAAWYSGEITVSFAILSEACIIGGFSLLLAVTMGRPWELIRKVPRSERLNLQFVWSILPHGIRLVGGSMLQLLNGYISLAILRLLGGDFDQVGYYSRGLRLATLAVMAIASLQRLLYANWSGMDPERKLRSAERTVNFAISATTVVTVCVLAFARPLTLLLFGAEFLPAVTVTRLTVGGVAVFVVVRLMQALFNSDGRSQYNLYVLGVGLVTNVIGAIALVPRWQANGAAAAVLISFICMAVVAMGIARKQYGLNLRRAVIPNPSIVSNVVRSVIGRPSSLTGDR